MALRGQGDSPVRICDPCKKQEEAARSERYGHKNRAGKAASKVVSRGADEVLNELLGGDSRGASSNEDIPLRGIQNDMLDVLDDEMSIASDVSSSSSPDELRQQALEEKNKYKALKGEGKSSEALKAFKRAKELERQAAAMELQLRKSRRRALASSSISSIGSSQKTEEIPSESSQRGKNSVHKGKKKDDINDELKALGWSETDIHEVERKPATTSVESELLNLMGETSGKAVDKKGTGGVDKSEVVALKKKALMLKREGRLAEAKEELKKAKVLEKQLEEQEFLADADESDDEISALIRSMDGDNKHDNSSIGYQLDSGFDFHNLGVDAGDIGVGNAIEVTDDDMYDPDLFATLKSLGWTEEPDQPAITTSQPQLVDKEQLKQEVLSLKKEALAQKRAGNAAEAISLLKKAKLLEKDLQGFESPNSGPSENHSELEAVEPRSLNGRTNLEQTQHPKSRVMIQKELLALKKKALALRREGKLDEAEEELQKGKILEQQLEDMDNAPKTKAITLESTRDEVSLLSNQQLDISTALPSFDDDGEGDITEQDLHDPAYLTLLNSMGWQDEDKEATTPPSKLIERHDPQPLPSSDEAGKKKTKLEIQRELLGLKRKAMALRRQGQSSEAEEFLEMAKELESKLAEMEAIVIKEQPDEHVPELSRTEDEVSTDSAEPASKTRTEMSCPFVAEPTSSQNDPTDLHSTPQQLILIHKRKAVTLKREGRLAEAREELKKAKQLEKELEGEEEEAKPRDVPEVSTLSPTPSISSTVHEELSPPNPAPKPMSSHERFKLQRECLNHKRSALKLRREGRGEEADAELQIAKTLEAQLEEASGQSQGESSKEEATKNDVELGDLLDPQILSALRAIGIQDDSPAPQPQSRAQPMKQPASAPEKGGSSSQESVRLEAEIKAEKVKALNLKRSGKQAEALDCLRRAKQLEKKLSALPA